MTHYYSLETFKYARPRGYINIPKILERVFVLTYSKSSGKHFFNSLKHVDSGYMIHGDPVVFETLEHEREFLDYHPDTFNIRRYSHWNSPTGYFIAPLNILTEDDIPIYKKGNRWYWKKTT